MKMSKSTKDKARKDELDYCIQMVEAKHRSPHWSIRVDEITKELNKLKGKKK